MSEQKHTPGPWEIVEYGDDDLPNLVIHRGKTENRICFMATPGSHGDPGRIEADARLIAAAPDMLEALREILRVRDWAVMAGADKAPLPQDLIRQFALMQIPAIDAARAALSKAEGRKP